MHHIDYGLGVITPSVFESLPDGKPNDLEAVLRESAREAVLLLSVGGE